jgi:hypothetical protein
MAYGVRVAETRLEQNRMHLTCVLNYYHLYLDRSIKQPGIKRHHGQIGNSGNPDQADIVVHMLPWKIKREEDAKILWILMK